jgi:serine/threonine protein kinase
VSHLPDDDPAIALPAGTEIGGRLRIERCLGVGGFGVTYRAHDTKLHRTVALKEFLPRQIAIRSPRDGRSVVPASGPYRPAYEMGLKTFEREARILASLEHPNIVRIYDICEANGTAYLIMRFLEGMTLEELIEARGKLPWETAAAWVCDLMYGLRKAHEKGLIHCDVSPDNIYLARTERENAFRPILLDFGGARRDLMAGTRPLGSSYGLPSLEVVKYGYSPIEQYQEGGVVGPWSDVYSTAASLYRSITGIVPPRADERRDVLLAGGNGGGRDPLLPPSSLGIPLPKGAEEALMWALAIERENRPRSVHGFQDRLLETLRAVSPEDPGAKMPEPTKEDRPPGRGPISREPRRLDTGVGRTHRLLPILLDLTRGFLPVLRRSLPWIGGAALLGAAILVIASYSFDGADAGALDDRHPGLSIAGGRGEVEAGTRLTPGLVQQVQVSVDGPSFDELGHICLVRTMREGELVTWDDVDSIASADSKCAP